MDVSEKERTVRSFSRIRQVQKIRPWSRKGFEERTGRFLDVRNFDFEDGEAPGFGTVVSRDGKPVCPVEFCSFEEGIACGSGFSFGEDRISVGVQKPDRRHGRYFFHIGDEVFEKLLVALLDGVRRFRPVEISLVYRVKFHLFEHLDERRDARGFFLELRQRASRF